MHIIKRESALIYIEYVPTYIGLNVKEFGKETNSSENFKGTLRYRNNHIIHFVLDGHGEFYCNNKTYQLSAGQAFVITPKNLVRYEPAKNASWTYCWLAFSGADCDTLFKRCGFNNSYVFNFKNEMISPLLEMIASLKDRTPTNETAFSLSVSNMANEVLKNCALALSPETVKSKSQTSNIVEQAISYMNENYNKPINISILCNNLHVSRGYFSTLFASVVKQSPYHFLQTLRLQRASELLLINQNLRVYEIAEIVGFSSTAQFCKAFLRENKMSPSEYREKYGSTSKTKNGD